MQSAVYTLVLCDYQMPYKNGDEIVAEFREWELLHRAHHPRQRVYGLTAYDSNEVKKCCMAAGMQGILNKPLNMNQLRSVICN